MTALVAIRHLPLAGVAGRCYGRTDHAPDPDAIAAQVPTLAERLPRWPLLSSPAARCLRLASALSQALSLPLQVEPRLAEVDFGAWEDRPWNGIERAGLDAWAADLRDFRPPGGESTGELFARVHACVLELAEPTILVTHAGPIRALWHWRGGLDFAAAAAVAVPHAEPVWFPPA
jgi:alpha-ribazole phosphatase